MGGEVFRIQIREKRHHLIRVQHTFIYYDLGGQGAEVEQLTLFDALVTAHGVGAFLAQHIQGALQIIR